MLRANALSIYTHLGREAFENIGVIISDTAYGMISPMTAWENPEFPGRAPARISAEKHRWEEATNDFKTYNTVQSALKS
jgi:hypothetical protein